MKSLSRMRPPEPDGRALQLAERWDGPLASHVGTRSLDWCLFRKKMSASQRKAQPICGWYRAPQNIQVAHTTGLLQPACMRYAQHSIGPVPYDWAYTYACHAGMAHVKTLAASSVSGISGHSCILDREADGPLQGEVLSSRSFAANICLAKTEAESRKGASGAFPASLPRLKAEWYFRPS